MNINSFTPSTGLRGEYTLKAPFDKEVTKAIYTCKAIRRISSLTMLGEDVYATYYQPYGLTLDEYEKDAQGDRDIITIISDGGVTVNFPVGYLTSYPDMNGEPYQTKGFVVKIPTYPRDTDYSGAVEAIRQAVISQLGVEDVSVHIATTSDVGLVEESQHKALKAARRLRVMNALENSNPQKWRKRYEDTLAALEDLIALKS